MLPADMDFRFQSWLHQSWPVDWTYIGYLRVETLHHRVGVLDQSEQQVPPQEASIYFNTCETDLCGQKSRPWFLPGATR